jgi:hypothetical protein
MMLRPLVIAVLAARADAACDHIGDITKEQWWQLLTEYYDDTIEYNDTLQAAQTWILENLPTVREECPVVNLIVHFLLVKDFALRGLAEQPCGGQDTQPTMCFLIAAKYYENALELQEAGLDLPDPEERKVFWRSGEEARKAVDLFREIAPHAFKTFKGVQMADILDGDDGAGEEHTPGEESGTGEERGHEEL